MKKINFWRYYKLLIWCLGLGNSVYSQGNLQILNFNGDNGFQHTSKDEAMTMLENIGAANGWIVNSTSQPSDLNTSNLAQYDVVIFNNNCGDAGRILSDSEQLAFQAFIRAGGGFVAIHCAGAWWNEGGTFQTWYEGLVGARMVAHPAVQEATLIVEKHNHISTVHLPNEWVIRDEWHTFVDNPRDRVNVLISLDESTYTGTPKMGGDHPFVWFHHYDGGRAYFSSLGHEETTYADPNFQKLIEGGIKWAGGLSSDVEVKIVTSGLIVDLNADSGLTLEETNRVSIWKNQVDSFVASDFVKRDVNRTPGTGRPTLKTNVTELNNHNSLIFEKQELLNMNEDAFDHLITGSGYTWVAVMSAYPQTNRPGDLADVNVFLGNLKNGGNYEGFWGGLDDDNTLWMGSRNGITMGRWDANNPKVSGSILKAGQYYILAGRMSSGTGTATLDLFVNNPVSVATSTVPVNINANASKLAIGTERDAIEHPGVESFDGEISRVLIYERPLNSEELNQVFSTLSTEYFGDYVPQWSGPAPSSPENFERKTVLSGLHLPMEFEIHSDGTVYVIQQTGEIVRGNLSTGRLTTLGKLPVYHLNEHGGLGLALDPDFGSNGLVYALYTPTTGEVRISRFTVTGSTLDLSSEKILLQYAVTVAGHMAGSLSFGLDGNLYIATGANDGPGNSVNGRLTAGNTNDLRGKILRIKPVADGTSSIPNGNLFSASGNTRPEIYSMGHRNPFRFSIDPKTGWLYVAEVGSNWEEINQVRSAANYGWPFFEGDLGGPVTNTFAGNTGLTQLPDALPTWITYQTAFSDNNTPSIPGITPGGGAAALAGPVYYYPGGFAEATSLPSYYHGGLFWYDFNKGQIFYAKQDSSGGVDSIEEVFQGLGFSATRAALVGDSIVVATGSASGLIDMKIDNTGHLYAMEYWSGNLYKIEYKQGGSVTGQLIAHWPLDENSGTVAADALGNNNGLLVGGPVWSTGQEGGALSFDGVDDQVNLVSPISLSSSFTIAGWVNLNGTIDNRDVLVGTATGNNLNFYDQKFRLWNGTTDPLVATTPIQANTWTHVAITRNESNNLALYLNGAQDAVGNEGSVFTIDGIGRGTAGFLQGMIDDLYIFNYALTPLQVQNLMSGQVSVDKYVQKRGTPVLIMGTSPMKFVANKVFDSPVLFTLYNFNGEKIKEIVGKKTDMGWVGTWNSQLQAKGIYWLVVTGGKEKIVRKVIVGF